MKVKVLIIAEELFFNYEFRIKINKIKIEFNKYYLFYG